MKIHTQISRMTLALLLAPTLLFGQAVTRQALASKPMAQPAAVVQSPLKYSAEQQPVIAPQITCNAGMVTLRAENSTLASVLHAVARCAGAIVHMPAEIGTTRVVARYGPVQPMALFAALLDGSADYVILGAKRNQSSVQMVIVKPHQVLPASGQVPAQAASKQSAHPATFIDEEGVERLPSGLTEEESNMTPEELAQKFEASRQEQKRLDQLAQPIKPQQQ